jgi:DNA-binding CsgD family transcriptional regulator
MPHDGLTQREREVLHLLAYGHTSKQVAQSLAVSIHTVSNHRKHICRKLSLHSTAELVAFAARTMCDGKVEAAGNTAV